MSNLDAFGQQNTGCPSQFIMWGMENLFSTSNFDSKIMKIGLVASTL